MTSGPGICSETDGGKLNIHPYGISLGIMIEACTSTHLGMMTNFGHFPTAQSQELGIHEGLLCIHCIKNP